MIAFLKRMAPARFLFLIVAGIAGAALYFGFGLSRRPAGIAENRTAREKSEFEVDLADSRKVAGFVATYGREIDEQRRTLAEREKEIAALREGQEKSRTATEALLAELANLKTRLENDRQSGSTREGDRAERIEPAPDRPRIQKIALAPAKQDPGRQKEPTLAIPAGSFAEATLLTGLYAPTEGAALPVQLRLDAALVGPNRSRVPIAEAFLIGRAQGDANSRRIVVQLSKLSYVARDGKTIERPVNGYVADSDGVLGIAGEYVWRMGESLALAGLTGATSAGAEALAARETATSLTPLGGATQVVTGDPLAFAGFRAASGAAHEMGKIVADRMRQVVPAIYAPNGRQVTVLFLDGVTLEGLKVSEISHASDRNPYAGLDLDR